MPSYLLLQSGDRLLLQGTGALLLQGDGDAPASVGPRIAIAWRDRNKTVSYKEGGRVVGRIDYSQHAEDPGAGVWWTDRTDALVDFTGYTFTAKIHAGGTTALTKTSGITGSAGSGSPSSGTPNIAIDWSTGELNITPGEYTLELTPRSGGRDRDPISIPVRITRSAP